MHSGLYGVRRRRTQFLGDQLDRAGAGSWQIADEGATRKAAAGGTSVGVRRRLSSSLRRRALADPPTVRLSRRAPIW